MSCFQIIIVNCRKVNFKTYDSVSAFNSFLGNRDFSYFEECDNFVEEDLSSATQRQPAYSVEN